jgi:hypothetical protein
MVTPRDNAARNCGCPESTTDAQEIPATAPRLVLPRLARSLARNWAQPPVTPSTCAVQASLHRLTGQNQHHAPTRPDPQGQVCASVRAPQPNRKADRQPETGINPRFPFCSHCLLDLRGRRVARPEGRAEGRTFLSGQMSLLSCRSVLAGLPWATTAHH